MGLGGTDSVDCWGFGTLTDWQKKPLLILAANPPTRWPWNKEAVGRVREVLDNARDTEKNVLNGGQRGLNEAFCSPHYVLEGLMI